MKKASYVAGPRSLEGLINTTREKRLNLATGYVHSISCRVNKSSLFFQEHMDYYTLTDEATVSKIADTIPRSMSAYFICLHAANETGFCYFTRAEIEHEKMRSWTKFKNDIRSLAYHYLLNYSLSEDAISIFLIPQESHDEDYLL